MTRKGSDDPPARTGNVQPYVVPTPGAARDREGRPLGPMPRAVNCPGVGPGSDHGGGAGNFRCFSPNSRAMSKLELSLAPGGLTPREHAASYASLTDLVVPAPLPQSTARDRDDDHVIACAAAASPDAIVSGDADLLVLGAYEGMAMLR